MKPKVNAGTLCSKFVSLIHMYNFQLWIKMVHDIPDLLKGRLACRCHKYTMSRQESGIRSPDDVSF